MHAHVFLFRAKVAELVHERVNEGNNIGYIFGINSFEHLQPKPPNPIFTHRPQPISKTIFTNESFKQDFK